MDYKNLLTDITTREQFRNWLDANHDKESECWLRVCRRRETSAGILPYIESVYEALCFGWIDAVTKRIDGMTMQRFAPRRRGSIWSELNKERCRMLEREGLMTEAGRAVLPDMTEKGFSIAPDILEIFRHKRKAWRNFRHMPELYQRVRIDTIQRDRSDMDVFRRRVDKLIEMSAQNKMFGQWNDDGKLLHTENADATRSTTV